MKELKNNEMVKIDKKIYTIKQRKWCNGKKQGKRYFLILLNKTELLRLLTQDGKKIVGKICGVDVFYNPMLRNLRKTKCRGKHEH